MIAPKLFQLVYIMNELNILAILEKEGMGALVQVPHSSVNVGKNSLVVKGTCERGALGLVSDPLDHIKIEASTNKNNFNLKINGVKICRGFYPNRAKLSSALDAVFTAIKNAVTREDLSQRL